MPEKSFLSVAIITKNEAENLPACLASVAFAEQVVVVDSDSTDATLQIAREFGCDLYVEPWRGFGLQKQSAIDHCRHAWILLLDADERIPPETAAVIAKIVANQNNSAVGYRFPRKNYFQGRWIKHAGWWPDPVTRLFRKGSGRMTEASVHEAVALDGEVKTLNVPIEHFTESRLSRVLLKIDHYSTLGARDAFAEGRRATVAEAALRATVTFLQDYLLRLGILDGSQGLTLAVTDAVNKFFKYAKLAEMGRKKSAED